MNLLFFIASGVAIFSTFMAVTNRHAVHALLYLILSLLSVAVIFFILGAPFVAALEVIIYAGAIVVLFLFVIMMLNFGPNAEPSEWTHAGSWVGPGVLAAILLSVLIAAIWKGPLSPLSGTPVNPSEVGLALFGPYMLAVQLGAMLLLAGLVGATHLRKRDR